MSRWKTWLFGGLGATGSVALILYASSVVRFTQTPLQLALLVFTALAAGIGWLGLLISYLTYRLEAGRVPKPDVRIIDGDSFLTHWKVQLRRYEAPDSIEDAIEKERRVQEDRVAAARSKAKGVSDLSNVIAASLIAPSQEDWNKHSKRVERYLSELAEYLKMKALFDEFQSVSRNLLLAFTNDRGGAPADGVLVRLHFPEEGGLTILPADRLPNEPDRPKPPHLPTPHSGLDHLAHLTPAPIFPSLGEVPDLSPPGNVSPPTFGKGSVRVEYEIKAILHNVPEDNRNEPLVAVFQRSGRWEVPYEVHARNLLVPRKGKLVIEAKFDEEPSGVSFDLPDADSAGFPPGSPA